MAKALSNYEVVVLAYVRENGERYESDLLQKLERHNFAGTDRVFWRTDFEAMITNAKGYYELLSQWVTAFENRVDIRTKVYDRSRFLGGNIVVDFLQWLGLEADAEFAMQSSAVNPSLDTRAAAVLLLAKHAGLEGRPLVALSRALLANIEAEGAESRHFLDSDERNRFWQEFREDNERLFEVFTPENALPGERGFPQPDVSDKATQAAEEFSFLKSVTERMSNVRPLLWQGNTLVKTNLDWILSEPSVGWRPADSNGALSYGATSVIRFQLPYTHDAAGPTSINVTLAGSYLHDGVRTRIKVGELEAEEDLTNATVLIPIDSTARAVGVTIALTHVIEDTSASTLNGLNSADAVYRLEFLAYRFSW